MSSVTLLLATLPLMAYAGDNKPYYPPTPYPPKKSPSPKASPKAKSPSPKAKSPSPKAKSPSPKEKSQSPKRSPNPSPKQNSQSPKPSPTPCPEGTAVIIPPAAAAGQMYFWGWNVIGQCGDGSTNNVPSPSPPAVVGTTFAQVAGGRFHSGAFTTDGSLYMWGRNDYGQVGTLFPTTQYAPVLVSTPKPVALLALGGWHSGFLTPTGQLYMWGWNGVGQLGAYLRTNKDTPTAIPLPCGVSFKQLSLGFFHSGALSADGDIYMWGYNVLFQLGDGTNADKPTPTLIKVGTEKFQSLSLGLYHSGAVTTGGELYLWGSNTEGQIGDGTFGNNAFTPKLITIPGKLFSVISLGGDHSGALSTAGELYGWGSNVWGQVGDNTTLPATTPRAVATAPGAQFTAYALSDKASTALGIDGQLYTWGTNVDFVLASNRLHYIRPVPEAITTPPGGIISLSAGLQHVGVIAAVAPPVASHTLAARRADVTVAEAVVDMAQDWAPWAAAFALPAVISAVAALIIIKWRRAKHALAPVTPAVDVPIGTGANALPVELAA